MMESYINIIGNTDHFDGSMSNFLSSKDFYHFTF